MRVLLGSGGIGTEERRKLCMDEMSRVFEGVSQVLFIPYASNDHDSYLEGAKRFTSSAPFDLVGIHDAEDELDAIKEAEGIYVCLLYTSPSPRDGLLSRMPSSA